jgi:NADPH:quinone reductase-like Zn-dependent oxidoreductase
MTRRRTSAHLDLRAADPRVQRLGARGYRGTARHVQSGRLKAVVDATYPLERAAEALARLEDRQVFGKLVIVP